MLFRSVLTQLKAEFGPTVCPVVVPVIADRKIVSYVNLIEMKAYKYACDTRDCSSCKSKTCKCRECHLDKNAWEWRGAPEAPEVDL